MADGKFSDTFAVNFQNFRRRNGAGSPKRDQASPIPAEFQTISTISKGIKVQYQDNVKKREPLYPGSQTDRNDSLSRSKVIPSTPKYKQQASSPTAGKLRNSTTNFQVNNTSMKERTTEKSDKGVSTKMSDIQDQYYTYRGAQSPSQNRTAQSKTLRDSSGPKVSVINRLIVNKSIVEPSSTQKYPYKSNKTGSILNNENQTIQNESNLQSSRISINNYMKPDVPITSRPSSRNSSLKLNSSKKSSSARELDVNVNMLLDKYKQLVQKQNKKQQQEEEYQQSKKIFKSPTFHQEAKKPQQAPYSEVNYFNSNKYESQAGEYSKNPALNNTAAAAVALLKLKTTSDSDYQIEKSQNLPSHGGSPSNKKTKTDKKDSLFNQAAKEKEISANTQQALTKASYTTASTTPNNRKNQQGEAKQISIPNSQNKLSHTKEAAKAGSDAETHLSSGLSSSQFGSFLSKPRTFASQQSPQISPQESCSTERTPLYEELVFLNEIRTTTPSMDDFTYLKVLGKGSYALVRSANHKKTGFQVAIKSYDKTKFTDPQRKQNVEREIEILSHLNHKHIIKLYKSIENQECVNLIMEYTPCAALSTYLKSKTNKRMHEIEAKSIFRQIVEAVVHLHTKKIIHRDIKLENILIDSDRQVKLIDFGFSVIVSPPYRLSMFCGTPSYMAPEIVSKAGYSFEVDTWALGILLYKLLTGTFPFVGEDDKTLYKNIIKCKYDQPMYISSQVRQLMAFMLKDSPAERIRLVDVLKDDWFEWK